ncbi:MAG: HupE/UreJ family protein [Caldimonas sp.]
MRCSDGDTRRAPARATRCAGTVRICAATAWLRRGLICLLLLVSAAPAMAHKASDSYLQIDEGVSGLSIRWDIALRDLDVGLDLDLDGDGELTWAEVKAAWPRIESYALAHLQIEGCAIGRGARALERRSDGAYAVLHLNSTCRLAGPPVIAYTLFRDVDPTHRGIAKIQRAGAPLLLAVLDPTQPPAIRRDTASAQAGSAVSSQLSDRGNAASAQVGGSGAIAASTLAPDAGGLGSDALTSGLGFAKEGIRHILTGYDHVLFLLCLLLPSVMRRTPRGWRPVEHLSQAVWPIVGIVSAFTVAHSITLGLAATKVLSLPPSIIEPGIAITIILAALDNVWPFFPVPRVVVTFLFGLIHGFGFAGVLAELELPPLRFAWALLQFNLGLELGQLMIVVMVTTALFLARGWREYSGWVIRGGSYAAICVGMLWLVERTANVSLLGF